ncbi:MAG: aminoglycoside phosphotransferase [Actinomycetia bacterium]|nr:aminoglycoside phosphotransferase [Actinomycetes bacterium]
MELIASGRTAEVFAWADGQVLKLDRPEWNGLSAFEASALARIADTGIPAPRAHREVTVGGRHGVVLDRVDGPSLAQVLDDDADASSSARRFVDLQRALNGHVVYGLPDLIIGLEDGIRASSLDPSTVADLLMVLDHLDDGRRCLCHFDLHPGNVIVTTAGWVVIDWLTASSGPPDADFARTLVLGAWAAPVVPGTFTDHVLQQGLAARRLEMTRLHAWIRVIAGARLAEGFGGAEAAFMRSLASGEQRLAPDG